MSKNRLGRRDFIRLGAGAAALGMASKVSYLTASSANAALGSAAPSGTA